MANEQADAMLNDEELRAFADKLNTWGQTLSEKEQTFLVEILGRAADSDLRGYASDYYLKLSGIKGESAVRGPYFKFFGPASKIDLFPTLRSID
jgi:hypothetical protein